MPLYICIFLHLRIHLFVTITWILKTMTIFSVITIHFICKALPRSCNKYIYAYQTHIANFKRKKYIMLFYEIKLSNLIRLYVSDFSFLINIFNE